jgi:carboxymethylenebutenolidase
MSCCPPGSLPYLAADSTSSGSKNKAGNCDFYETGSTSTSKALVMIPDVWGWDTGRIRALADHFAATANFLVVIPKLLADPAFEGGTDGDALPPNFDMGSRGGEFQGWLKDQHPFTKQQPLLQDLHGYLCSAGVEKIYLMGICWGGYAMAEMMGVPSLSARVVAGASVHPSVRVAGMFGKSQGGVVKAACQPILWMPTGNDPDDYRTGGEVLVNSPEGSKTIDYPSMTHGFFTRGDAKDGEVAKCVEKAVGELLEWYAQH